MLSDLFRIEIEWVQNEEVLATHGPSRTVVRAETRRERPMVPCKPIAIGRNGVQLNLS